MTIQLIIITLLSSSQLALFVEQPKESHYGTTGPREADFQTWKSSTWSDSSWRPLKNNSEIAENFCRLWHYRCTGHLDPFLFREIREKKIKLGFFNTFGILTTKMTKISEKWSQNTKITLKIGFLEFLENNFSRNSGKTLFLISREIFWEGRSLIRIQF
jgi:hypothetical protein